MSSETPPPRALVRWSIRALPVVGLVIGAARGDGVLGALLGLAVGYAAALVAAFVLWSVIARRARRNPAAAGASSGLGSVRGTGAADGVALAAPAEIVPPADPAPTPTLEAGGDAVARPTEIVPPADPGPTPPSAPVRAAGSAPTLALVPPVDVVAGELGVPDDEFVVALDRAAARHGGVLCGRFVLVDGELRAPWGPGSADAVSVLVDDTGPTPYADAVTELVPLERVAGRLSVSTYATHAGGGVLELTRVRDGQVTAVWWRGENADRAETIPAGFLWEKNDDYMHGPVDPADLGEVTFRLDVR